MLYYDSPSNVRFFFWGGGCCLDFVCAKITTTMIGSFLFESECPKIKKRVILLEVSTIGKSSAL